VKERRIHFRAMAGHIHGEWLKSGRCTAACRDLRHRLVGQAVNKFLDKAPGAAYFGGIVFFDASPDMSEITGSGMPASVRVHSLPDGLAFGLKTCFNPVNFRWL